MALHRISTIRRVQHPSAYGRLDPALCHPAHFDRIGKERVRSGSTTRRLPPGSVFGKSISKGVDSRIRVPESVRARVASLRDRLRRGSRSSAGALFPIDRLSPAVWTSDLRVGGRSYVTAKRIPIGTGFLPTNVERAYSFSARPSAWKPLSS